MLKLTKSFSEVGIGLSHTFLIFGVGLIGQAIAKELELQDDFLSSYKGFSWTDPLKQSSDFNTLKADILNTYMQAQKNSLNFNRARITFIWSAGPCGFQSKDADLALELVNFKRVVNFSNKLVELLDHLYIDFHLVSSSGAIFEGQRSVTVFNEPKPRRPYAFLKLEQEQYLLDANIKLGKCIYRPSSVYGNYNPLNRISLIPIMIYNGMRNYTTSIFGSMDTIRDYVYVEDVSRFIVRESLFKSFSNKIRTYVLASARPATIMNIKQIVESTVGRKIYLTYHPVPSELAHNSFMPSALPLNFSITSLETCIRKIHRNL